MNHLELIDAALADPESIIENSFKNFHTKGFDYLCLHRSPEHTLKLYFLDGDASKLPEVVNPHDHRYDFQTRVLAGEMFDYRYTPDPSGEIWNAFDYMTPLNGGDGFKYRGEERLVTHGSKRLSAGTILATNNEHTHTIRMVTDQTVLLLDQFDDVMDLDAPSSCWSRKGDPIPDLQSGAYERFTPDEIIDRIGTIKALL